MNEKGKKQKKNSRVKWTVLLLLLVLLIIGTVVIIILLRRRTPVENIVGIIISTESSGNGVGLTIDPDAEGVRPSEDINTAEHDVVISGRKTISIPANSNEIAVDLYNPKENEGLYYMTFEIRLCDQSKQGYEVLYTSELIEPGKHINRITLSRTLERGTYDAVIHVQPYRMNEERTLTNNADMKTTLIVK